MIVNFRTAAAGGGAVLYHFYHGTNLQEAKEHLTRDLQPESVRDVSLRETYEYTDFGKGFYVSPEKSKHMALQWAKKAKQWGVVRFSLYDFEIGNLLGGRLFFRAKRNDRPGNAPILFNNRPASWIEFVEHNRKVKVAPQRPKDNDWTWRYSFMQGPFWTRKDSGLSYDHSVIPEHIYQINWGRAGLAALNHPEAKKRRVLFDKSNEGTM